MKMLKEIIETIRSLPSDLHGNDFLLTWEKSTEELQKILWTAEALKYLRDHNISPRIFDSGLAVSIFRDNSTRTRFSFASAANLLGLQVHDMDESKSQIAHGETVRETASMISFLTDVIGIRDDMYLGAGHTYMQEFSAALKDGFQKGVLPQRPGLINLQCDLDHPTQSMADLLHLKNYFGSLEALRGKKIAMTWAYSPSYGKPLSVPQGIIGLMTRFGMDVALAFPEGYSLVPEITQIAEKNAKESGGRFQTMHTMEEAFAGADIVYPKSWAPLSIMEQRTQLLKKNDQQGLTELEKTCLLNNAEYKNWECDKKKMALTKNGSALYMHCLPADISGVSCEQGEVQAHVFEKYRIETYKEAGYKPYIIASMIANSRLPDSAAALEQFVKNGCPRVSSN
ncbi:MAG: knotted carbamoyltransferase YgeW [SAR324 cluster bacterium]|nr:knotted carbamoyltransferase YgeW [SAR324 cluster bacterium]